MGNISKNFSYEEFVVSETFPMLAAQIQVTKAHKVKLFWLVHLFLQPFRDFLFETVGEEIPITINSGIRDVALNSAVKGVASSDHLYRKMSCAVDFFIGTKQNNRTQELYDFAIVKFSERKEFVNQLIIYLLSAGNFIHLSTFDGGARWDIKYCASRTVRAYFPSYTEAEAYQRGVGGG